jgi:hypothetical protein
MAKAMPPSVSRSQSVHFQHFVENVLRAKIYFEPAKCTIAAGFYGILQGSAQTFMSLS